MGTFGNRIECAFGVVPLRARMRLQGGYHVPVCAFRLARVPGGRVPGGLGAG
jgi:hypothetical protein